MNTRVLVVCLGNIFYRDDRAGLEVCKRLEELGFKDNVVSCDMGFERCLGDIVKRDFNTLIIVDAFLPTSNDVKPGDVIIIEGFEDISSSVVSSNIINTHKLPLPLVLEYLKNCGKDFYPIFIGVCIENLDICDEEIENCELSENVEKGVEKIVRYIVENYLNGGTSI
ncbi:MAG: hydrogenase maturation protease [Crenarchaeota archaeon]|nr:hydrogenase maturation protease [Thermoproteota archaeon]